MKNQSINSKPIDAIYQKFQSLVEKQQFHDALDEIMKAHRLEPHAVIHLSNAASVAHRAGLYEQSIDLAKQVLKLNPKHINALDVLSHAYSVQQNWAMCRQYGGQALHLRDEAVLAKYQGNLPSLPSVDVHRAGKKVIAFSLFGHSPKYLESAVLNTQIASDIYPDWICRFYVDDSVPRDAIARLQDNGAEIVHMQGEYAQWVGTVWRFLAIDDADVARVIFRDADSVISPREAMIVREWEASGKLFHTIRDSGSHTELILAGLWGAVGGAVPDMAGKLRAYFQQPLESVHFADQFFLRHHVWGYVRQSLMAHDRLFGFLDARAIPQPSDAFDFRNYHIGASETSFTVDIPCPFPEGTMMNWTLYSRVAPLLHDDYSLRLLPEKRMICTYDMPVVQGKIRLPIPRRYAQGIKGGDTHVDICTVEPLGLKR